MNDDLSAKPAPKTELAKRIADLSPEKRALLELKLKNKSSKASSEQTILRRVNRSETPLSFAQQRLWFLNQLEPNSPVYNISKAVRLSGSLNIEALQKTLEAIASRHEILRTTFVSVDGNPVQVIAESVSIALPIIELSELSEGDRSVEIQRLLKQEAQRPFNLSADLMLRACLLRVSEFEHILLLVMHHIASDGWSVGILYKEMTALYEAFSTGKSSSLSELPIQYADFASWQQQWLQGDVLKSQLTYWKKQLDGAPPVLNLPTDNPHQLIETFRGAKQNLELSQTLSSSLLTLSRSEGVTLFMTLLAAFKILLNRYSGQEDILVGTPVAGRKSTEIEGLIGFFINTLVLRTNLSECPTFRELLHRLREVALEAYSHQDFPFEKLVEVLQPERNTSRTPLFQVWFNMVNLGERRLNLSGLKVEPVTIVEPPSKFDLTVYIREQKEGLQIELVYNADLFKAERMDEMLRQFEYLLGQIIERPDEKIANFSLVTLQAKLLLPNPSVTLDLKGEEAVHTRFSQQAIRRKQHLAVVGAGAFWSYAELEECSNQLANYWCENGIKSGDIVAIYADRSPALVLAILGILKAGAAFLILDSAYPASRLLDCLQLAMPKGWIQMEEAGTMPMAIASFVDSHIPCRLSLSQQPAAVRELLKDYSTLSCNVEVNPDRLAYIAFTSGSTGKPKGILGTHRPLSHFLAWHIQTFSLNEFDRFSMLSGLSHDPLLRDIFTPLWLGATLFIPQIKNIEIPGQLLKWMQQVKISIAHLTPAMAQLLTETTDEIASLRYVFFGGDVLTKRDVARIQKLSPRTTCVNFYGATETPQVMGYFIYKPENNGDNSEPKIFKESLPVGKGIQDVQLLILNSAQQLCGIGELGEICIRTPYLAKGYLDNNALDKKKFIVNPFTLENGVCEVYAEHSRLYKTGDLGRYLPDGNVAIFGRADNQVKIRGFRIELGEIEALLATHPDVKETTVIVREDSPHNKLLLAYIVPHPGKDSVTVSEFRTFLKDKLPDYMVPNAFILLDRMPLTPNGKIDRQNLPDRDRADLETGFVPASDALEIQLKSIWQEVLGVTSIGVKDNFFELGGHSLLAVRLFAQIEKVFDKNLPLATLFQAPTIEQLANILRQKGWSAPWKSLVLIQPGKNASSADALLPLFCIHAVGGNVLSYQSVASYLVKERPVYGLQARGLDGKTEPHTTIEEMAADYIKEMRIVQPHGPYFLAGHSSGGVVAFEIAQQLVAAGEKVALVALFDTYSPILFGKKTPPINYQLYIHWFNLKRLEPKEKIIYILDRVRWNIERLGQKIMNKFYARMGRSLPDELPEYLQRIESANRQVVKNYVSQVYPGKVTLFRAIERPTRKYYQPDLGWMQLAAGGVEIIEVPGHHKTMILEPRVRFLGKKLQACLDRIQD